MNEHELLNQIRKTTDMGVVGIAAVEKSAKQQPLRSALAQQKQEYRELYNRADCLLQAKGGRRSDLPGPVRSLSRLSSGLKLMTGKTDSRIAEMMIEGNTKGMIKSYQNLRATDCPDGQTLTLSRKLLETELHNIEQMKKFL